MIFVLILGVICTLRGAVGQNLKHSIRGEYHFNSDEIENQLTPFFFVIKCSEISHDDYITLNQKQVVPLKRTRLAFLFSNTYDLFDRWDLCNRYRKS